MFLNIKSLYSSWWKMALLVLLIMAIGFFLIILLVINMKGEEKAAGPNLSAEKKHNINIEGNFWIGAANPKITIVEFADFSCAFCQKEFSVIRALSVKYKNEIKIVFKDYPVVTDRSTQLALSARCAGEQGLFWPMHDKLFLNQGVSSDQDLSELAKQIGADESRFSACLSNNRYFSQIKKDFEEGEALGVTGTPTWFINGYKIAGDVPLETFEEIIAYFLNTSSTGH